MKLIDGTYTLPYGDICWRDEALGWRARRLATRRNIIVAVILSRIEEHVDDIALTHPSVVEASSNGTFRLPTWETENMSAP